MMGGMIDNKSNRVTLMALLVLIGMTYLHAGHVPSTTPAPTIDDDDTPFGDVIDEVGNNHSEPLNRSYQRPKLIFEEYIFSESQRLGENAVKNSDNDTLNTLQFIQNNEDFLNRILHAINNKISQNKYNNTQPDPTQTSGERSDEEDETE